MPTVSIVVPNLMNDMHDGSISQGDAWFWNNLSAYYQWARTHNSLLILTFDEDDSSATNQIFTLFLGPMVAPGTYSNRITHFNLLRTIEDMYGLGYAGAAASVSPITVGWVTSVPSPPTLSAQAGDGRVSLSWTTAGGAQSYNVYRGTASNSETQLTSVVGGTGYIDTLVANGTTYYYRITAVNANGQSAPSNEVNATPAAAAPSGSSTPYGGIPAAIPGAIEAENFDDGGASVAYVDSTSGNRGGAYRHTDVDIEATSDDGGGYDVGWARPGEWLQYTVNVASNGQYDVAFRLASSGSGGTLHLEVDGSNTSGAVPVPYTGGWQIWATTTVRQMPLTAGTHRLRVVFDTNGSTGGVANVNRIDFSPSGGSTPYGGTPVTVPGRIEAENFDNGGQSIAYVDTTSGNRGATYRQTDVDIEDTADVGGGWDIGWTRPGEWLQYTVNVTATGTYTVELRVASPSTGGAVRVEVDDVDVTGSWTVPNTGGWQVWDTMRRAGVNLTAGQHRLRLVFVSSGTNGIANVNFLNVTP
jgi:fibronectin type 3 domain-containing protein